MKKLCRKSGKVKYRSHEHAATRAGRVMERDNRDGCLSTYKCPYCGSWHITSTLFERFRARQELKRLKREELEERQSKIPIPPVAETVLASR